MTDFLTLACPACGGKLQVSPAAQTLKCDHCGTEHLVRREAGNVLLEAFARCPKCQRNDKVEKVSAIVSRETVGLEGITLEKREYTDSDGRAYTSTERVPFTGSQSSMLARRLSPPAKPVAPVRSRWGTYLMWFGAFSVVLFGVLPLVAFPAVQGRSVDFSNFLGSGCAATALAGLSLIVMGGILQGYLTNKQQEQETEYRTALGAWNQQMDRWNQLYYCGRDDCVFVPGSGTSMSTDRIQDYITR